MDTNEDGVISLGKTYTIIIIIIYLYTIIMIIIYVYKIMIIVRMSGGVLVV